MWIVINTFASEQGLSDNGGFDHLTRPHVTRKRRAGWESCMQFGGFTGGGFMKRQRAGTALAADNNELNHCCINGSWLVRIFPLS